MFYVYAYVSIYIYIYIYMCVYECMYVCMYIHIVKVRKHWEKHLCLQVSLNLVEVQGRGGHQQHDAKRDDAVSHTEHRDLPTGPMACPAALLLPLKVQAFGGGIVHVCLIRTTTYMHECMHACIQALNYSDFQQTVYC